MSGSEQLAGRRVLVTGGFGFVGARLARTLGIAGAHVTALGRPGTTMPTPPVAGVEPVELDLLGPDLPKVLEERSPQWIFHLAGHASIQSSFASPAQDLEDNAATTVALLEAMRRGSRPARLVFASSSAVYGGGSTRPLPEDAAKHPRTPYGVSKLCAETYVTAYAHAHGVEAVTARLFPLYGPGQRRHVIFDLLTKLTRDSHRLEVVGDGSQTRDFLYIDDCVRALLLIADQGTLGGEVYNVSGGVAVTIRELVGALCRHLGVQPDIRYTGTFRPGGADHWIADTTRIRALGFTPRVDLDRGLSATVAWYREHEPATGRAPMAPIDGPRDDRGRAMPITQTE